MGAALVSNVRIINNSAAGSGSPWTLPYAGSNETGWIVANNIASYVDGPNECRGLFRNNLWTGGPNSGQDATPCDPSDITLSKDAGASQVFIGAPADFRLKPGSPAFNAGSGTYFTSSDIAGNPRPRGAAPDIGAYESQQPINTALPSVSISDPVRSGVNATTSSYGTWTGTDPITYTYQWLRCDNAGDNCTSISGATGNNYTLADADVSSTIRLRVSADNTAAGGQVTTADSAASSKVAALPPSGDVGATLTGAPMDGETMSASPEGWAGTGPLVYSYQWLRCDSAGDNCADIPGATDSTYKLMYLDTGGKVRVRVSADNSALYGGGSSAPATSGPAGPIAGAPVNDSGQRPSLTAQTPVQGIDIVVAHAKWHAASSYTYQWQRCASASASSCTSIFGASSQRYTPSAVDRGSRLRALVTAVNQWLSATEASALSNPVVGSHPFLSLRAKRISVKRDARSFRIIARCSGGQINCKALVSIYKGRQIVGKASVKLPAETWRTITIRVSRKLFSRPGTMRLVVRANMADDGGRTNDSSLALAAVISKRR